MSVKIYHTERSYDGVNIIVFKCRELAESSLSNNAIRFIHKSVEWNNLESIIASINLIMVNYFIRN